MILLLAETPSDTVPRFRGLWVLDNLGRKPDADSIRESAATVIPGDSKRIRERPPPHASVDLRACVLRPRGRIDNRSGRAPYRPSSGGNARAVTVLRQSRVDAAKSSMRKLLVDKECEINDRGNSIWRKIRLLTRSTELVNLFISAKSAR